MPFPDLPTPAPEKLEEHYILGEIIEHLEEFKDELHNSYRNIELGLLRQLLVDVRNHSVEPQTVLRRFLKVYKETQVYQNAYSHLDESTKAQIDAFIDAKPEHHFLQKDDEGKSVFHLPPSAPAKHHFKDIIDRVFHHEHHEVGPVPNGVSAASAETRTNGVVKPVATDLPVIYEDEKKTMKMEVHAGIPFSNWGQTVNNVPKYTFVPKTVLGLQNLVKYAKEEKLRVRCGGYRHSWSDSFSQDNHVLISLLNLEEVTTIPDPLPIGADYIDPTNELKVIQMAPGATENGEKSLVRVGVSVTNEQFRRWAVANGKWALPMDVILVE
jgi:hypothetical protein